MPRHWRSRFLLAGLSVAATLIVLGAAEIAWRASHPVSGWRRVEHESIHHQLRLLQACARVESRSGEPWLVGVDPEFTRSLEVPLNRSAGVARIAIVGESSAAMLGYAMDDLLATRKDDEAIELLHCGLAGTSLEQVELRLEEVLRYSPDAIVFVFGHNIAMSNPMDSGALRRRRLMIHSRLVTDLADRIFVPGQSPSGSVPERIKALRRTLERLDQRTRPRGITVVVHTLAGNLRIPPSTPVSVRNDSRFVSALAERHVHGTRAAIDGLRRLVEARDEPYWRYTFGSWLEELGDLKRAAAQFRLAKDADVTAPNRATSSVNAALRVAAREAGFLLRDTQRAVAVAAPGGIAGWESLRDNCHLTGQWFSSEARATITLLSKAGRLPAATPDRLDGPVESDDNYIEFVLRGLLSIQERLDDENAWSWIEAADSLVAYWLDRDPDGTVVAIDAFIAGSESFAIAPPDRRAHLLVAMGNGAWRAGQHAFARRLNDRARALPVVSGWIQRAGFLIVQGRVDAARDALANASQIDPHAALAQAVARALDDP